MFRLDPYHCRFQHFARPSPVLDGLWVAVRFGLDAEVDFLAVDQEKMALAEERVLLHPYPVVSHADAE